MTRSASSCRGGPAAQNWLNFFGFSTSSRENLLAAHSTACAAVLGKDLMTQYGKSAPWSPRSLSLVHEYDVVF